METNIDKINSVHTFIKEVRNSVNIPVLSIVDETVDFIKAHKLQKIGFISTLATVANKVYENQFIQQNIDFVLPNDLEQAEMNQIIQRLVNGIHLNHDRKIIMKVIETMKKESAECVFLACTDLQLLLPSDDDIKVYDTMDILAESVVREILND